MTDNNTADARNLLRSCRSAKASDCVADELLEADATQAAASPVGPRGVPKGAVRVDYLSDGRFRLVRSDRVWSVEEEIEPGVFKQHDGHYQSEAAAGEYIKRELIRREYGFPSGASGSAIPLLDEPKLGRILMRDGVRAIAHEETSIPTAPGMLGPCTATESARYAFALRQLLESLDGEIVVAALVGEGESDLLNPERQEVDRVRKFLDGRIVMRPEPSDFRGRALTVLNAFMDKLEATAQAHESSPSVVDLGDPTVGDGQAAEGDPQPSAAEPPAPKRFHFDWRDTPGYVTRATTTIEYWPIVP